MAEHKIVPKTRLDLARILKANDYGISETLFQLERQLELELDQDIKDSLRALLRRIKDAAKKAKKSLDNLEGDWWNSEISLELGPKVGLSSEPPSIDVKEATYVHHRKDLDNITLQQQRVRLSSVLDSIRVLAEIENTSQVKIAALALQLLSNKIDDRQIAKVSKSIVYDKFYGQFGKTLKKEVDVNKSLFLLDLLEIGKRKYTQLRQHLLTCDIYFPAYQTVADHRNNIVLRSVIQLYPNPTKPVGVYVPYAHYVQHTFSRIMGAIPHPSTEDFPLKFQIANGLDGSGSHTIYNQQNTNTATKTFILFCFKPIQIMTCAGVTLWKNNIPNSPYSQRPIFLCAEIENEENIRQLMITLINPDTEKLKNEGINFNEQHVEIDIVRSMLDGKMAAMLSGAGEASCQLCTATFKELKDRELVIQGFPINRHISDAIQLFGEIEDSDKFFSLPSNERFNLTHEPLSTINILAASPLHSIRAFSDGLTYWSTICILVD